MLYRLRHPLAWGPLSGQPLGLVGAACSSRVGGPRID